MQILMCKLFPLLIVVFFIGCKSNSIKSNANGNDTLSVEIKESPVKKKELKGQELLDSFADEYYLHYPDNVLPSEMIKAEDDINPRKYYKKKDFVNAYKYYKPQVQENPDNPYVNFYAAMSAYNAGEYDGALELYNRQQSVFPDDKYTLVTYFYEGLTYLRKGEVEKCQTQMQNYLDRGGIMEGRIALLNQDIRLKWKKPTELQP